MADAAGNRDIWLLDVAQGIPTRFTFDPAIDWVPVWSPDGSRLFWSSGRAGASDIYQKASNGSGNEELVLKSSSGKTPSAVSPDGRNLLFSVADPRTGMDQWVLPLTPGTPGAAVPAPYLQSQFNERQGQFSPDGRWVAYVSDESGKDERVYVQSFPAGAGKFQVSAGGGVQPRWRGDGKEIFYLAPDQTLMAVDVSTAPTFQTGAPRALFRTQVPRNNVQTSFRYDVTPDGKQFLLITPAAGANTATTPINVLLNWQARVRR
jgi:Tol biopolymer transport system component